jgi:hypothetical protein
MGLGVESRRQLKTEQAGDAARLIKAIGSRRNRDGYVNEPVGADPL